MQWGVSLTHTSNVCMGYKMKIFIIEATYDDEKWFFTKKQTYLPEIKEYFVETKNGYRYYFNPEEEEESVAMEIFKGLLIVRQREKIKELYDSIKALK